MLHPGHSAAVGHCLIKRIASRSPAERFTIALAKPLDRVFVEQCLRSGHEREGIGFAGRSLVGWVEAAEGLDLVAEEIEPERRLFAGRKQIDQRASNRELAALRDGVGALVTKSSQLLDQLVAVDPVAFRNPLSELADPEGRQDALHRAIRRQDEELRLLERSLQRIECRQPLRHHPERGGSPVVRKTVPRRKRQDFDFGREGRNRVRQRPHCGFVGGDYDRARWFASSVCGSREVGRKPREEAVRNAGKSQRLRRAEDSLKRLGHFEIGI